MPLPIPANALFGLLAALFWGGGDFSGSMGARHAGGRLSGALRIILLSHSVSLCILLTFALLRGDSFPHGSPLFWGILAGIIGGLSLSFFYIALARGAMGVAAAISGLLSAAVPAIFANVSEGSPGPVRLLGFGLAAVAIWMVAAAPSGVLAYSDVKPVASTNFLAVLSGTGFGIYFIALKMAAVAGVVWPVATARMGSIITCSLFVLCLRLTSTRAIASVKLARAAILWALSTALLDTCGNLLFISATRAGRLDIAAVLASLYPATTILLAGLLLKERFSRRQSLGVAIAAAAVVIITL